MWMTHPQVPPLPPCFAKVTIPLHTRLTFNLCRPLPQEPTPSGPQRGRGIPKTDVTHPVLRWGGANVGLQHLGRVPSCSEAPDTCFLWYFVPFFFSFFCYCAPRAIFSVGAPTLTRDFTTGRSEKRSGFIQWLLGISLGIYPVAAREIAWDFSGGRSGDPQGYSV